jgi:hypothetical protein
VPVRPGLRRRWERTAIDHLHIDGGHSLPVSRVFWSGSPSAEVPLWSGWLWPGVPAICARCSAANPERSAIGSRTYCCRDGGEAFQPERIGR